MSGVRIEQVKGHKYRVHGDERVEADWLLPSVTQMTKYADSGMGDGLIWWGVNLYEKTGRKNAFVTSRSQSTAIGSMVHDHIDYFIHHGDLERQLESTNLTWDLFMAWHREFTTLGVDFHAAEAMVYHPRMLYGGTVDAIGTMLGHVTLFDWKTTDEFDKNGKKKELNSDPYAAQAGGYYLALKEVGESLGIPIPTQAFVVYIFKDSKRIEWHKVDLGKAEEAFRACFKLHTLSGGLYEY